MSKVFPQADLVKTSNHDLEDEDFVVVGGEGLFLNKVIPSFTKNIKTNFDRGQSFLVSVKLMMYLRLRAEVVI